MRMDKIETRRENLRRWVREHGTPVSEKSLFSQLKGNGSFGEKVARRLEDQYKMGAMYLDYPVGQLGDEEPLRSMPGGVLIAVDAYNHNENPNVVQVPRVELRVSAGITGFAVDGSDDMDLETYPLDRRWVERNGYAVNKLLAMYVKGDSMYPTYKEGDIIVINTADTKMEDTKEYVFNFDGDVVLKTLTRERGTWWLTSVNDEPKYHQRSVRSGETFIIGRVVKHDRVNL